MKTVVQNVTFTVQIFKEEKVFVSYCPELKVSSCGKSIEEAKNNLKEAISGFLKSAKKMNTLQEIMEEAGFTIKNSLRFLYLLVFVWIEKMETI